MPEETYIPTNIYWDVFPKLIRLSVSEQSQSIPLSIRGNVETPVIESSNTDIVNIDGNGNVICGTRPGSAIVMIWHSDARESLRHVQVEVYEIPSSETEEGEILP